MAAYLSYQQIAMEPPEWHWEDAEEYMRRNPNKDERVIRTGPNTKYAVVRDGDRLYRRTIKSGEIVSDIPVLKEVCVYCGAYDTRYPAYRLAYHKGFACTECANGILGNM
jgi:hypothetical protein